VRFSSDYRTHLQKVLTPVAIALSLNVALGSTAYAQEGVKRFEASLDNIETSITRLAREYANPLALVRQFPFQKRLIDAQVFYELGNYESAAIVLMDVIETPAFQGNLEFETASLLLAQSLLKIDNVKAARTYFETVTRGRNLRLAEEARFYLIDMALDEKNDSLLREIVAQMGGAATSDRTRYGLGKAQLRLGEPDKAILWLQVIGPQSEYYGMSRYYLGVALTAKAQYNQALQVFWPLTKVNDDAGLEAQGLRDLTWLAVGRLQMEQTQLATALTSYQNIGRNSPHYEVALYEMAWAYIKQEQYDKALLTVDILLLTVSDESIDVDAHVLRGRLNIMMDDYDEAVGSYGAIIDRFAPIRNELVRFTRDPGDIQNYFQWLLERQAGQERLTAPLTKRTSAWVEATDDIGRVAAVFDRISTENRDIAEAREVGGDLERILTSSNRVELFPNLREGWTRALVMENQLVNLSSSLLDAQAKRVKGRLSAADATELSEMIRWRKRLEEQARLLPTSYEGYERRKAEMDAEFGDLERKNFIVEQNLTQVQRDLLAIEQFLNDKQFSDTGEKMDKAREQSLRAEIEAEKAVLQGLFDELVGVQRSIRAEALSVGTGDRTTRGEANLKQKLFDTHVREGRFYDRVGLRLKPETARSFASYRELRQRVTGAMVLLDGVVAAIDQEVGVKTASLRGVIAREMNHLGGYATEVTVYDAEGRQLASEMGEELFQRAQVRMDEVVLEADVGLLDVAWQQKQKATRELQAIDRERSGRVVQLQDDLRVLTAGIGEDAQESSSTGSTQPSGDTPPKDGAPPKGDTAPKEGTAPPAKADGDDNKADTP
jgi:tetratricopeptide (TPR) repeat protein